MPVTDGLEVRRTSQLDPLSPMGASPSGRLEGGKFSQHPQVHFCRTRLNQTRHILPFELQAVV